jgi:hypothetical protein
MLSRADWNITNNTQTICKGCPYVEGTIMSLDVHIVAALTIVQYSLLVSIFVVLESPIHGGNGLEMSNHAKSVILQRDILVQ